MQKFARMSCSPARSQRQPAHSVTIGAAVTLCLLALACLFVARPAEAQLPSSVRYGSDQPIQRAPVETSTPTTTATVTPTVTPSCAVGWNVVPSPALDDHYLSSVDALSSTDIWAVGWYRGGSVRRTLTMHWDGTQWSVVPSPSPGTTYSGLQGVAAISSNNVWAVGDYWDGTRMRTLTMRWDGTQWSTVPSPNVDLQNHYLNGVAAVSPTDIWAVGYSLSGLLILHWNGTQWSVMSTPTPAGAINTYLMSVYTLSSSDVWAVGAYTTAAGHNTLTLHWDGSQWAHVPSPGPPTNRSIWLTDVHGSAPDNVWAVGYYSDATLYHSRTFTLRWNGSAWSYVASPSVGSGHNYLHGVAVVASDDVWAVGDYGRPSMTIILRWNGTEWTVVDSPNPSSSSNHLTDVTALSADELWAVGDYDNQSLILKYTGTCSTPTATSTIAPSPTPTATIIPSPSSTPHCTTGPDYYTNVTTGATIVPGTTYVGATCDSCTVWLSMPFAYSFYGATYQRVNVSNKGVVQFASNSANGDNTCLPNALFNDAILAYWDDHNTNINDTMGIFTSVSGAAPNRIFNIEWRSGYVANDVRSRFQVRLYEGEPKFDVIYANTRRGFSATVGVQKGTGERFTQYVCNTNNGVPNGTRLTFDQRICSGALPTRP